MLAKVEGAPAIVEKTLTELKIKDVETVECDKEKMDVINIEQAKVDFDANRITMDKGPARFFFDIID